jgi:hypothetical protein
MIKKDTGKECTMYLVKGTLFQWIASLASVGVAARSAASADARKVVNTPRRGGVSEELCITNRVDVESRLGGRAVGLATRGGTVNVPSSTRLYKNRASRITIACILRRGNTRAGPNLNVVHLVPSDCRKTIASFAESSVRKRLVQTVPYDDGIRSDRYVGGQNIVVRNRLWLRSSELHKAQIVKNSSGVSVPH